MNANSFPKVYNSASTSIVLFLQVYNMLITTLFLLFVLTTVALLIFLLMRRPPCCPCCHDPYDASASAAGSTGSQVGVWLSDWPCLGVVLWCLALSCPVLC